MKQLDDLQKPINKTVKQYDDLQNHIEALKENFTRFYDKDVQAAGVRVRQGMQALKRMAQEIRVEVKEKRDAYQEAKGQR